MSDFLQVNKEFILRLYDILGQIPPDIENLSEDDLLSLSEELRDKIAKDDVAKALAEFSASELQEAASAFSDFSNTNWGDGDNTNSSFDENSDDNKESSMLIIDDLGVITYQLNITFQKHGFNTSVSQEIFDALDKFKTNSFDWVIMDLFIPTEREGLMLLSELRKIINLEKRKTKIVIISATNKKEHKKICFDRGADFFVEKASGWQNALIEQCVTKKDF